tara:strand:+ start:614 stop:859 length:246 start_codon:yes stop_codon:yes gene_type:complete
MVPVMAGWIYGVSLGGAGVGTCCAIQWRFKDRGEGVKKPSLLLAVESGLGNKQTSMRISSNDSGKRPATEANGPKNRSLKK